MTSQKHVLTTGDVARICNVAPRTVSKWFDTGQLRGYRIPGSKDRRIPKDQLVRFMRAHGLPLNGIESDRTRVLIVDDDEQFGASLAEVLVRTEAFMLATANSALEAGAAMVESKPQVVLLNVDMAHFPPKGLGRFVRRLPQAEAPMLVGMSSSMTEARGQALLQEGFHAFLTKPFDVRSLVRLIQDHASASHVGAGCM